MLFNFLKLLYLLLILQIISPIATQAQVAQNQDNKIIRIGVIIPLTGDFGFFGEQVKQGIQLAEEELKSQGDTRVELIVEDDKCLPKQAVTAASKLLNVDKVDVILGPGCTGSIRAVAPLVKRAGKNMLAILDANQAVVEAGDHVFALGYSSEQGAYIVAEEMIKRGIKRAAVLYEADEWANLIREAFKRRYTERGGEIVSDEIQDITDSNYKPNILKLLGRKPDGIYMVPAFNGGTFVKQLREMQIKASSIWTRYFFG